MTLDELRRLDEAATPGPWGIDRDGEMFPVKADGSYDIQGEIAAMVSDNLNDGRLILAARNALPALLRVAEAAAKLDAAWQSIDTAGDATATNSAYHDEVEARVALCAALTALEATR